LAPTGHWPEKKSHTEISLDSGSLFLYIADCKMEKRDVKKKRYGRENKSAISIPFTRANYQIFGAAMVVLLLGYVALATGPVDGFVTMTVAPILLVIGYCILIPIALLFTARNGDGKVE